MSRPTRVLVQLSCGCERRMPRATASRAMTEKTHVSCATHGDDQHVSSMPGPASLSNLFKF